MDSYINENGVCYMCLCDQKFPKKLTFGFLRELQQAFDSQYGDRVSSAERPYEFIGFGKPQTFVSCS